MTPERMERFAVSKGCKWLGDRMVGAYRGYPFVTTLTVRKISVLNTTFVISGRWTGKLGRRIRKELPKGCSLTWGGRPVLLCSGQEEDLLDAYVTAMEIVASAMQKAGIGVPDQCPICRQRECDSLALVGGLYQPVHRACCEEKSYSTVTRAEVNARNGSYLTGILGAVLGALIASVPSLLTTWFLQRIYALLFILIPLGAYHGYRLLRGKMTKVVGVVTVIVSLLMPFVMEQILFYLVVATTFGIVPSFLETVPLYFEYSTLADMVVSMGMSYVFLLVGLWATFRQITRTSTHEVTDASVTLDSVMPYRPSGNRSELEL